MRQSQLVISLVALALVSLSGCVTVRPGETSMAEAVQPVAGEQLVVDEVLVLLDASGSMYCPGGFDYAKELARSLVNGMPAGAYDSGLLSYGGEWVHEWVRMPLEPFTRQRMLDAVAYTRYIGGSTTLDEALELLRTNWSLDGPATAIVLISDGKAEGADVLDAATALLKVHGGRLCIHTVQVGDDDAGGRLLHDLAALSDCGSSRGACEVAPAEGMQGFVHEVFFGGHGDSDEDGVPDSMDQCLNTPKGAPVNEQGCWLPVIHFDSDQAVIKPKHQALLDQAAHILVENPAVDVRIAGHTDDTASEEYNKALSQKRAQAVRRALIKRGVAGERIKLRAFGETTPIVPNDSRANRAKNRRAVLHVIP